MTLNLTQRPKKALRLAEQAAKSSPVAAEHVLFGLLREGTGVAALLMKRRGVGIGQLRKQVKQMLKGGPVNPPEGVRVEAIIALATEEAHNLNHNYVGTEHLLLAILRGWNSSSGDLLRQRGLDAENVRTAVIEIFSDHRSPLLYLLGSVLLLGILVFLLVWVIR